ncbi:unnamed protein product, partial [Brachionus calyciflorus]
SSKNIEPLHFWKLIKENNPILFQVFLRIFCVSATLVPSEQIFSAAGYTVWDRQAIQRLADCFYLCIYKLLKINLNSADFNDLNNLLEKYGLFAFQHRALERMLKFSYKIINFANSTPLLKDQLLKNETRNLKYDLRNKDQIIECGSKTSSGERTFNTFKLSMFNNINLIYEKATKFLRNIKNSCTN